MGAFGGIPSLFDRNFAVGSFVPAGIMVILVTLVLDAFGRLPPWWTFESVTGFLDAALVAVAIWLLALLLVAVNRTVVRTLEGYSLRELTLADVRVLGFMERHWTRRYRRQAAPALDRQKLVDQARAEGRTPPQTPAGHAEALRRAVERFPDEERHVLPTAFGNRYRAIEIYSRAVYGLDAIPAWPRLQAVLPEDYRDRIAEAKAKLDFCVNLLLAGAVTLALYAALAVAGRSLPEWWLIGVGAAGVAIGYRTAGDALGQFGEYVKSAFDLYRGDLADRLGLELPRSPEQEREMWTEVNRVMVYRSAAAWSRLTRFRKKGGTEL